MRLKILVLCLVSFLVACGEQADPSVEVLSGPVMGTQYQVKIVVDAPLSEIKRASLDEGVHAVLSSIDEVMSTYKDTSDLSRFNQLAVGESVSVNAQTAHLMRLAEHIREQSEGAFDVRVATLVNLWGFGPKGIVDRAPVDEHIAAALEATSVDGFSLTGQLLHKTAAIELDLSAIAKGYAVDQVAKFLRDAGMQNFLIEVGGEILASGYSPRQDDWVLGIEEPDFNGRKAYNKVYLRNAALATSGDYRNYFEADGVRYSHTIDPSTGRPVLHRLASVSVVHASCAIADAWATALMVLGEDRGMALANKLGLAAYFIVRTDNGFEPRQTAQFAAHLSER